MIVLLGGASHTGKTLLAQKLMEFHKIPYMSLDHLKMGLVRGYQDCGFTPTDSDEVINEKLWGVVKGIVDTCLENQQQLIVEGCYLPQEKVKALLGDKVVVLYLVLSNEYIKENFAKILHTESVIEKRFSGDIFSQEECIQENEETKAFCIQHDLPYLEIKQDYEKEIEQAYRFVDNGLHPVAKTSRMVLRKISEIDAPALSKMLSDPQVMYAWEKGFTPQEVMAWIGRRQTGYETNGYDYYLAYHRETGEVVGQIGLVEEDLEGEKCPGIGYILNKEFWHQGYATEGAETLINMGLTIWGMDRIVATIRPENKSSLQVAQRLGMVQVGQYVKHYMGKDMPHLVLEKRR